MLKLRFNYYYQLELKTTNILIEFNLNMNFIIIVSIFQNNWDYGGEDNYLVQVIILITYISSFN